MVSAYAVRFKHRHPYPPRRRGGSHDSFPVYGSLHDSFCDPLLRFPLRAGGTAVWFPSRSGGNLQELIRVHRLGSLRARCSRFSPSPPPLSHCVGEGRSCVFPLSRLAGEGDTGGEGKRACLPCCNCARKNRARSRDSVPNGCTLIRPAGGGQNLPHFRLALKTVV